VRKVAFRTSHFSKSAHQHFIFLLLRGELAIRNSVRVECLRLLCLEDGGAWGERVFTCSTRSGLDDLGRFCNLARVRPDGGRDLVDGDRPAGSGRVSLA